MKTIGIGLALSAFVAAVFASQNHGWVAMNFFSYHFTVRQGLFSVSCFGLGMILMAILSMLAGWEFRGRSRREIARRDRRIEALEKEREAMLSAMRAAGASEEEISFIEDGRKA